jgi:hypothetical protein
LKKEAYDDLYYTLEGVIGCKGTARAILHNNFDDLYAKHGDSKELYEAIYSVANFETVDGLLVQKKRT